MPILNRLKIGTGVLFLLISASLCSAQAVIDLSKVGVRPGFFVDLASFYQPATGQTRLEVYYKIHNHHLSFVKTEKDYLANYELRFLVLRKGRQVAGTSREEQYRVPEYSQTSSRQDYIINQLILQIEPGKYEAKVTLIDKSVQKGYTLELPFSIPDYAELDLAFSDVEFAEKVGDTVAGSQFNKLHKEIIPKVRESQGNYRDSLTFYFEAYSRQPQSVQVNYLVSDYIGKLIKKEKEEVVLNAAQHSFIRTMGISALSPGRYTLSIFVPGSGSQKRAQTKQEFEVEWSIDYYVVHNFKEAIAYLSYLATGEELKALKNAPPEKRAQAWLDFWKSKDLTPDTPENEVQDEYYRRIRYANDNFGLSSKAGWKSDMGMVYIKYGAPDEIERHPYDKASKAYEVWYYYSQRRIFTFLDDGYGEYRLLFPYDGDVYH
jgi:GWxTD domain-containing protein